MADLIFTRDVLMHRIDVAGATGRTLVPGPHDYRVFGDCIKQWTKITGARVTFELTEPLGGTFVTHPSPVATIAGAGTDLARTFAGRFAPEDLEIQGDRDAALGWLRVPCPF